MEATSLIDDAEFGLPPEFLTDDDFLVEKEKQLLKGDDESNLFPYERSHGFGLDSGFGEENYLTGLTRKMVRSTLEDDFSGGFHAFPAGNDTKAWCTTRSPLCGRRNQNCHTRGSSHPAAWDLYCAAVATMNISDESCGCNSGKGVLDKRFHVAANDGSGCYYYSRQSLQYQKLQALKAIKSHLSCVIFGLTINIIGADFVLFRFVLLLQFQQLKQPQQLMQQSRGLKANNNNRIAGHVSAWSNQPQRRDGSAMRAVFLGDGTGKRRSTGTGVFLPRRVNPTSPATVETRDKPTLATVLVPARVAEVLNLDESVVQPSVRSSASRLNEASWRQRSGFSSQMKMEQTVNEPRLPSDWPY